MAEAEPPPRGRLSRWIRDGATLVVGTVRHSLQDRVPGLSAEVAFYLLLSLPPLLLVGLGAVGYIGELFGPETVEASRRTIVEAARTVLTASTVTDIVEPAVDNLLAEGRADILSIGAVLALWSGSRVIKVVVEAVTIAYNLEDRRSWWKQRLLGMWMTAAGVLTVAVLIPLLVAGPRAGEALAGRLGLTVVFQVVWQTLYYPIVVALGLSLLTWVYHIAPPIRTAWRRDLPGAVLAFLIWLAGSWGLRIYATEFIAPDSPYGYFGTPLVFLLWMYLSAAAVLVGAELNAEIEKMWPTRRAVEAEPAGED